MKLAKIHIQCLSPGMLQNPATPELLESLRTKTPVQKKTDISLYDDAKTKLYRAEDTGKMGVPAQNLLSAIVLAGQHVKVGKKAISTAKASTVFDFIEFVDDFLPFDSLNETGDVPWTPFPVKGTMHNGASEVAVCINRPRIPHWSMSFIIRFDETRGVGEDTLRMLIEVAGRKIGLCDWRPAKKGRFGRFIVKKIETLSLKVKEDVVEIVDFDDKPASEIPVDLLAIAEAGGKLG